jgi:T5orf172 domain
MATLPGQRAQFTWALNQYNRSDDPDTRKRFVRAMAKYIAAAPSNGFTIEQVTQGQTYPIAEVNEVIAANGTEDPGITEQEAQRTVAATVDCSDVMRIGDGTTVVYAYGYRCCPDRLKVGCTEADSLQRIAAQIGTSTPDKPVLQMEIKTNDCRALERALHAVLEARGQKIAGGGAEWFRVSRDEILTIYEFINRS